MYRILIFFVVLVLLLDSCSEKQESTQNVESISSQTEVQSNEILEAPTLEDSIAQIREWFKTINNNSNVGNYIKKSYSIQSDSQQVSITAFYNKLNEQRQKVIFKSSKVNYDLPIEIPSNQISSITREYYYWNDHKFFIYEIVDFQTDSTQARIENRFYLSNQSLLRWIHQKTNVDRTSSEFKNVQNALFSSPDKLIQSFNYSTHYDKVNQIISNTKEQVFQKLRESLLLRHTDIDSLNIIFKDFNESKVLAELFQKQKSYLYLLESSRRGDKWAGTIKLIGNISTGNEILETPGDLYYYIMTLYRKNDTIRLREMIPEKGYKTNAVVAIGDVSEPQYEHDYLIGKDSATFSNLGFNFSPEIFNYHVNIDSIFNNEGTATINFWGGGFSESLRIKSTKNKGYSLISHNSQAH
ncbi:hypothetical protein [Fulvivirga sediminis]|uniref:Uncharacterized protein n=1 Tax=Fulvivirga sediminis TaxID=2803949 RepID=A0A937K3J5_9BACT|nr:hypothetical protein [Fulvivirga sediminis]MBL3659052.1 hypothetical protein [Fulvivirga sediminis]